MASQSWKDTERAVAALVSGNRAWNSSEDIDVVTVSDWLGMSATRPDGAQWEAPELIAFSRAGLIEAWAIEVKNHGKVTLSMIEGWLKRNEIKAQAVGMKSGLVLKRKGGRGVRSPYVFVTALSYPDPVPEASNTEGHDGTGE